MTEVRRVVACVECRLHWDPAREQARCVDPSHQHRDFEVHRHRTAVLLPDGTEVVAVSFDATGPYARDRPPDYGLYLDATWSPPWPHDHVVWPDFGVPLDTHRVVGALRDVRELARSGKRVEVGCLGGHGRTGTALACLAVLAGHPAGTAVAWVRANYCDSAVETTEQEDFVAEFGAGLAGPEPAT
jgi:hypothetical protein